MTWKGGWYVLSCTFLLGPSQAGQADQTKGRNKRSCQQQKAHVPGSPRDIQRKPQTPFSAASELVEASFWGRQVLETSGLEMESNHDNQWHRSLSKLVDECCGLNGKCPQQAHVFICSPVGIGVGHIMESLGGAALLEEVCHWRWGLRFYSLALLPILSCFLQKVINLTGKQASLLVLCLPCNDRLHTLWNYKPK